MAWALQYDGVNDYLTMGVATIPASTPFEIEFRGTVPANYSRVFGISTSGTESRLLIFNSTQEVRLTDSAGVNATFTAPTYTKTDYNTFKFVRDASNNVSFYLNNVFVSTVTNWTGSIAPVQLGKGGSSFYGFGNIEFLRFAVSGSDIHYWDATASNHAAGSQPVLTETVAGNDATGVNFPTDGSAWSDLAGFIGPAALQFDGVNDYLTLGSPIVVGTGDFNAKFVFKFSGDDNQIFYSNPLNNDDVFRIDITGLVLFKFGATSINLQLTTALVTGTVYTIRFVRNAGVIDLTDDAGTSLVDATGVNTASFTIYGFGDILAADNIFSGDLRLIEHYSDAAGTALVAAWDATASSHVGGQPVLLDTVSANNMQGSNFPTDGSAWVDLGGGDTTGTIAVDLPVYTATSTATSTLPLTTANASVNIPVYTATSTATSTLPLTTANASFNIAPFTASATATVSAASSLASATFAIPSYTATATAESTIVLTTANASFNVAPFDAAILALAGSPPVDADIAFFAPSFTATASATYEAIAHADITVQSPVYDVTAVADYFIPLKQASFSFNVPAFNLSATAIEVEPSTLASALFNIPSFKADLLALSDVPVSTVFIDFTVPPYAISSTAIEALPLTSASVIFSLPAYKATLNARTLDYELLSNIIHIINTTNVIKIKD